MILQRFVSHCYHCFLEWKERGAGHMRIEEEVEEVEEEEVEEGPI